MWERLKELEEETQGQEDVRQLGHGQRDTQRLIHKRLGPATKRQLSEDCAGKENIREQGLQDCIANTQSVLLPISKKDDGEVINARRTWRFTWFSQVVLAHIRRSAREPQKRHAGGFASCRS